MRDSRRWARGSALAVALVLSVNAAIVRVAHAQTKAECLSAFDRGQELRDTGHLLAARERFTLCAQRACWAPLQKDCAEALEGVLRNLPSIVPGAKLDDGNDVTDVSTFVDGAPTHLAPGEALSVDPGPHTLRLEHRPYAPMSIDFVARVGERGRAIVATFRAPPSTNRPQIAIAPLAPHSPSPWAYVVGGIGIAALGSTAYFGASALQERDQLLNTVRLGVPRPKPRR